MPRVIKKDDAYFDEVRRKREEKHQEFMRPKPGETTVQWAWRVRKFRPMTHKEAMQLKPTTDEKRKVIRNAKKHRKLVDKHQKKNIRPWVPEETHKSMKHWFFLKYWASVKYGILPDDIEIGLRFFCNNPFRKMEFVNSFPLIRGIEWKFTVFRKKGYIVALTGHRRDSKSPSKNPIVNTGYFQLTIQFRQRLKKIYQELEIIQSESIEPEALELKFLAMANEIKDIKSGKKEADKVFFENDPKEDE